jgi:hypothetical protein
MSKDYKDAIKALDDMFIAYWIEARKPGRSFDEILRPGYHSVDNALDVLDKAHQAGHEITLSIAQLIKSRKAKKEQP